MTAVMVEYQHRPAIRPLISASPAQGLIWSLTAAGWTQAALARQLKMNPAKLTAMLSRQQITIPTHQAILGLYGRLARQAPPYGTSGEREAAGRARGIAAARGWAPPLTRVRRDGRPQIRRQPVEVLAASWAEMASHGMGRAEAATRLRVLQGTLDKAISRSGQGQAPTCPDSEETSMTRKREHWPPRGEALAENALELIRYGLSRERISERLEATTDAIGQAITRYNRKRAAETAPMVIVPEIPPVPAVFLGGGRLGCGTILALLLHQELGEPACEACLANADRRGYQIRTAAGTRLAA